MTTTIDAKPVVVHTAVATAGVAAGPAPSAIVSNPVVPSPPASPMQTTTDETSSTVMNRSRAPSDFDLRLMPHDRIVRRTLHPWSVHHSLPASAWIATISRPEVSPNDPFGAPRLRYVQFPFPSERDARKFCHAYTPPKPVPGNTCRICNNPQTNSHRNCRNCGVPLCDRCSIRWGSRMVPKTYFHTAGGTHTVRVCKSCDWLSNAFCLSLLQGRYHDALVIHGTVRRELL